MNQKLMFSVFVLILFTSINSGYAQETNQVTQGNQTKASKQKELEDIRQQLKPLRTLAYKEPDVIEARKIIDEAFRKYYKVLRERMKAMDSTKSELIDKEEKLGKELNNGKSAGSRAEDYAN